MLLKVAGSARLRQLSHSRNRSQVFEAALLLAYTLQLVSKLSA
jgi:hypothetical protein